MSLQIQKYEAKIEPITILLYGRHKVGKTTFASTAGKQDEVLWLTTERGLASIADKHPLIVPNIQTFQQIQSVINAFKTGDPAIKNIKTLVVDSLTEIAEKIENDLRNKRDTHELQMKDWGIYKDRLQTLIRQLCYELPVNIIVIAHEEIIMNDQSIDKIQPMIGGQMKAKIGQYFSILVYMGFDKNNNRFYTVENSSKYDVGTRYNIIKDGLDMDFSKWFQLINEGKPKTEKRIEEKQRATLEIESWIKDLAEDTMSHVVDYLEKSQNVDDINAVLRGFCKIAKIKVKDFTTQIVGVKNEYNIDDMKTVILSAKEIIDNQKNGNLL